MKWGVMILAAGEASRMGKAKMLLPFKDTTILEKILDEVLVLNPGIVSVVTGRYHGEISSIIKNPVVELVYNAEYQKGMSSSIQKGLTAMLKQCKDMQFLFILLADQPFLNQALLQRMIQLHQESKKGLIAASYQGVAGTPLLLTAKYFEELYQLRGDKGARVILHQNPDDLETVDFEMGVLDIDTVSDYERFSELLKNENAD
ncbi:MAG: hypothetical protein RI983_1595 [Bacteroidota bacterium]|jgi:molybdenum cofactor cytidylyltransferase